MQTSMFETPMTARRTDGLKVVAFAGGGGSCTGIEQALAEMGDPSPYIDVAINHDREAVAMHRANHPMTRHYCQNVWQVTPQEIINDHGGRPIDLLWASPDCKHFSKAKGGKPVEQNIRDLGWVVHAYARLPKHLRPLTIYLENVEEFKDWGPLIETEDGHMMPCPVQKGMTFKRWVRELRKLGYVVDYQERRASIDGTPTIRKRLYVIARCDGHAIIWPQATHGVGPGLEPFRTAAECIDWTIECPSIFDRKKALAPNTERRIARGIDKFVLNCADPFLVSLTHHGADRVEDIREPFKTVTGAHRGEKAVVAPTIMNYHGDNIGSPVTKPLATITANSYIKRCGGAAPLGVAAGYLVPRYGERDGQEPRCISLQKPMPVVVPTANGGGLAAAFMAKHYGGHETPGAAMDEGMSTITAKDHHAVVASHIINLKGTDRRAAAVDAPAPSQCAQGNHIGEVRAFLMKYHRDGGQHAPVDDPMHTLDCKGRMGLIVVETVPAPQLSQEQRDGALRVVRFLQRHGVLPEDSDAVMVLVKGMPMIDIGMRMLQPRELFNAQGFPEGYVIAVGVFLDDHGHRLQLPLTKTTQIRCVGNSVCPPVARALVRANYVARQQAEKEAV